MDMPENTDKRDNGPLDTEIQSREPRSNPDSDSDLREFDHLLDASGLTCPLPLLKMKQMLNNAEVGEVIHVIATDSGSKRDFRAYIKMTNHLIETDEKDNHYLFWITKKG